MKDDYQKADESYPSRLGECGCYQLCPNLLSPYRTRHIHIGQKIFCIDRGKSNTALVWNSTLEYLIIIAG